MRFAAFLYVFSFVSGAAALTYEVSWTKWLSLSFGSSTLGVSATVAGFMGGMGIGAWAYHRFQDRVGSPLRLYAILECAIAASAVGLTWLLSRLPEILSAALPPSSEYGDGLSVLMRMLAALGVLLVPAALMGATYPALCNVVISNSDLLDRHLGTLYGWNTIGAAFGALLAGIALIPAFGLNGAASAGVVLNLIVAAAAFAIDRRGDFRADQDLVGPDLDESVSSELPRWVSGSVLFVSGFTTLAYQIAWFRAYRPIAGESTFAFTIVLVTFLLGLGLGALPLRRVIGLGNPSRSLFFVQVGIALAAAAGMASLAALIETPQGTALSVSSKGIRALEWPLRLMVHGAAALAIMLPATLLMGLSFPLASRLFVADPAQASKRIGRAVLLANLGSIVGSIGAATILLPWLGTMGSTKLLVGVNLSLGILVAACSHGTRIERWRRVALSLVAVGVVASLIPSITPYPWNPLSRQIPSRIIFAEEGELSTVHVAEAKNDPSIRGMSIDGATIGVSRGLRHETYSKQILLAHLPISLDPSIRRALQIGLGSACTLDSMTQHPALERIDAVEINEAVVRGAKLFEESRAFDDPRVRVHVDDAIHYLLRTDSIYDLIVADGKQGVHFAGNAKVLSQEFYGLALKRLSEHGLFVQWISLKNLPDDFDVTVRTAASVFPHLNVFYQPPSAAFFVGSRNPLDGRRFMQAEEVPPLVLESLQEVGIGGVDWLRRGWMADREALVQAVEEGSVNRWGDPVLEFSTYRAPPGAFSGAIRVQNIERLLEASSLSESRAPTGYLAIDADTRKAHRLMQRAYARTAGRRSGEVLRLMREAYELAPDDPIVQHAWSQLRRAPRKAGS